MAPRTLPLGPTASLHNHTVWSDGEEEMAVMIRAARDAGLAVFGISDHWVCRPDGLVEDWAMPAHRLPDYVEALLAFRQQLETDSFRLLIGLEVDFFEENAAEVMAHLAQFPLDYTIGSAHCGQIKHYVSGIDIFAIFGAARQNITKCHHRVYAPLRDSQS